MSLLMILGGIILLIPVAYILAGLAVMGALSGSWWAELIFDWFFPALALLILASCTTGGVLLILNGIGVL